MSRARSNKENRPKRPSTLGLLLGGTGGRKDASKGAEAERQRRRRERDRSREMAAYVSYDAMYRDGIAQVMPGMFSQTVEFSDISYQSTVVVDHDRGCLIWAHEGTGKDVLNLFLDELTREQRRAIEVVTADGARWIRQLVKRRCPNARWVMDPFHVVQWMNDALDAVRCEEWNAARAAARAARPRPEGKRGRPAKGELPPEEVRALEEEAASIKGSRYALVKNPEDLTDGQRARLEALKKRAGSRLVRAWELKEDLRAVFRAADGSEAAELLDDWMHRAAYCKIAKVVAVEKKVRRRRDDIIAAVELGISNGRVEAINNKIKVAVRMGYGFRNTDNLVALLMLRCGDCQPQLPGRPVKARKKGVKGAKSVAA